MTGSTFSNGHLYAHDMPFSFDSAGHPMLSPLFWGRDGTWWQFPMLADTGADHTLMPEADAWVLGIPDVSQGHIGDITLTTADGGSITAFLHPLMARIPGTDVYIAAFVAFSGQARSRLLGRPDATREFVLAFDSRSTHLLRD